MTHHGGPLYGRHLHLSPVCGLAGEELPRRTQPVDAKGLVPQAGSMCRLGTQQKEHGSVPQPEAMGRGKPQVLGL